MRILMAVLLAATAPAAPYDFQVGIETHIELPCADCDGVALGDINGNGKMDIFASSGQYVEVFWFEQGDTWQDWTKHLVYQMRDAGEIEGNDLADFDGDGRLEGISLDQPNGRVLLHKFVDPDNHLWETAVLQTDRPYIQASLVTDYTGNGKPDLLYTWEGNRPGTGGIHLLEFVGEEALNPEHWRDHTLLQHESAWWLAPERVDMSGNGQATDLVFTARNLPRRNAGAKPGLYWLEVPDGLNAPLTRHVIDDTLRHPLHVQFANLAGSPEGGDLMLGGFGVSQIYWYERTADWQRHEIPLPEELNGGTPDLVWNVKAIPLPGSRDAVLAPLTDGQKGGLVCFEYVDGAYRPNVLLTLDYTHPMDDRILLYDFSGNGIPEAVIPDSGPRVDILHLLQFAITPAD